MFFLVQLACWSFLNHSHNLHLPMPTFVQRLHLMWSQSDQIIFHQIADVVYEMMLCKTVLNRLLLCGDEVSRSRSAVQNCSEVTAAFHIKYSLAIHHESVASMFYVYTVKSQMILYWEFSYAGLNLCWKYHCEIDLMSYDGSTARKICSSIWRSDACHMYIDHQRVRYCDMGWLLNSYCHSFIYQSLLLLYVVPA